MYSKVKGVLESNLLVAVTSSVILEARRKLVVTFIPIRKTSIILNVFKKVQCVGLRSKLVKTDPLSFGQKI